MTHGQRTRKADLPPSLEDRARDPMTSAAGLVTIGLAIGWAVWTWMSLRAGIDSAALVTSGVDVGAEGTLATIMAIVQWLLCIPHLVVGGLLLARAPSAFGAAAFILGTYGVLALLLAGGPLLSGHPGPNAGWGVAAGLGNLAALALVAHPRTRRDLDRAQMRREWVRARGAGPRTRS